MISDYFSLAFKNLKHRGIRSWLTLLGILIGVATVITLISLGGTLKAAVSEQFGLADTQLITINAGGVSYTSIGTGVNPLTLQDVKAIDNLGSVKEAVGKYTRTIQFEYNGHNEFESLQSIPSGEGKDIIYEEINSEIYLGRLFKDSDSGKVILGYNYYSDKEKWGRQIVPGKKVTINGEEFEVIGILEKGTSNNQIFMEESNMKKLLGLGDEVDSIIAQPVDKNEMNKTKTDIEKLLRRIRDVKENDDFTVSTPEATLQTINKIINSIQIFIIIIASISIFIGVIGIVNTMTTSVLERRKDIGIMKSIGARNEQIFLQFLIESGMLGLIGGLIGILLGTLVGVAGVKILNAFLSTDLKPVISIFVIIYSLIGSFIIGAIAGIIPALSAAKQNPVEALKG